jgi:subtilisin family serine protease
VEKIQPNQLSKQPFNVWSGVNKDEPDSDIVVCQGHMPTAVDSLASRGGSHSVLQTLPTGRGTTVAIVDSGINSDHLAFRNNGSEFKINQHSRSFVGGDVTDRIGHGTRCAGLLCGAGDKITLHDVDQVLPFRGIAPDAKVMACKVVPDGTEIADIEAVCNAIDYIREYNQKCDQEGCVDAKVDVVSLSFGMDCFHHKLANKIQEALYDDIIIVCAASNNGRRTRNPITYPARLGDVLCIGACTEDGKPTGFSPVGRELDFLAQGETLWAPTIGGPSAYQCVEGTSFAAPLVAGLVCLIIEDLRQLSVNDEGASLCDSMHNVWCIRELLKEMTSGEHSSKRGYGVLRPLDYFEKNDSEKLRIITTKILNI